jgi:hypothetical protein
MIFQQAYYAPMDRGYHNERDVKPSANIEEPIVPMREIGQTVTEGRQFGSFLQSAQAAIRAGAGQIELQTGMGGGGEPVGAESYGEDAREVLREIARANQMKISSVHAPVEIGNMSGFNPQQGGFSDEYRDKEVEEVKSAIKFAAETAQGGGVVIHTGEFQRPMFDAKWNKDGLFESYEEESERAVKPLVDSRTGRMISEVRMNQIVPRAVWNRFEKGNKFWEAQDGSSYTDELGNEVQEGDYVDYEGRKVDRNGRVPRYNKEKNTFDIQQQRWSDLVNEAEEINRMRAKEKGLTYEEFKATGHDDVLTPEEAFLHATTETQEAIARGWAGNYGDRARSQFESLEKYKKALKFYEKLEKDVPEDEKWRLKQAFERENPLIPADEKMPVEFIKEQINSLREGIDSTKEMVTGQLQSAEDQKIMRQYATSVSKYALKQSTKSYAEAGIEAMQQSDNNPHANRDVFIAPENIFPEMGYGSHPEELIELVQNARKKMVEFLTEKEIEHPAGARDREGNVKKVINPYFQGITKEEAKKEAHAHIKATLDTQHLGMWFNDFKPLQGETRQDRRVRFNKWYLEEIDKISKADIVGNIHLVDAIGGSHQHLPAGQGELPLKEAIAKLRKDGYKGSINAEGWGEERLGAGRILTETWKEFGTPINSMGGYNTPGVQGPSWGQVQHDYLGRNNAPYFVFGAYSPSNDWTLWSEVPME